MLGSSPSGGIPAATSKVCRAISPHCPASELGGVIRGIPKKAEQRLPPELVAAYKIQP